MIEQNSYYLPGSHQAEELDHAVAYFLTKDMQPHHTVEQSRFKRMV